MMELEEKGMNINGKDFKVKVLPTEKITNSYKLYGEIVKRKKTVKSFIKDNPKGTYVVGVAGHALTIKDGEVFDWNANKFKPTRKVQSAYEIKSKKSDAQLSLF